MLTVDPTLAALCLSILDGEAPVIGILADRMEEVGKEYHARHIRKRKRLTRDTKITIVTVALPDAVSDLASCGFAEHVLFIWEQFFRFELRPRQGIEARTAWLRGQLSRSDLDALFPEMYSFYRTVLDPFREREPYRFSMAAAQAAVSAYGLSFSRPDVESQARCAPSGGGYHAEFVAQWAVHAVGSPGWAAERDWQLNHLRELILSLLQK